MNPIEAILALLDQDGPLTEDQITQLSALILELTDEELAETELHLTEHFDEITAAEVIDAEGLALATILAGAIDEVRETAAARITEAEAAAELEVQAAEAAAAALIELQNRVHAGPDDGDPEDPGDDDPDDGGDDDGQPVVEVDVEVPVEGELVPAATVPAVAPTRTATRAQLRERTPRQHRAQPRPSHQGRITMRGAGNGAHTYENTAQIETDLIQRWRDLEGTTDVGRFRVATFATQLPEDRQLRTVDVTEIVEEMHAKISEPKGVEALVADGGICGPVDVSYAQVDISQASRPLRDAIAGYQSKRGGLSWTPSISIADILTATTPTAGRAIGVVTEAQDAASTYDKSFQTVACGTPVEKRIDAVYNQLKFGNFYDRTNPEGKAIFTDLSVAAYARFSEQRLYNAMIANSKALTGQQSLGASRDLLTVLNRWAINRRAQYRMPDDARVDVVIPGWVGDGLMPDDQTKALQSYKEQFEVTRSTVEAWLRLRNINVINWFQDDFTTAMANGAAVNAYPTSFKVIGFHPGAHVYVDAGELNLGVVRDTTQVANNTFLTFQEEFWTTGMWGVWSDAINFSLCANGASAGSKAPTCGS